MTAYEAINFGRNQAMKTLQDGSLKMTRQELFEAARKPKAFSKLGRKVFSFSTKNKEDMWQAYEEEYKRMKTLLNAIERANNGHP